MGEGGVSWSPIGGDNIVLHFREDPPPPSVSEDNSPQNYTRKDSEVLHTPGGLEKGWQVDYALRQLHSYTPAKKKTGGHHPEGNYVIIVSIIPMSLMHYNKKNLILFFSALLLIVYNYTVINTDHKMSNIYDITYESLYFLHLQKA